MSRKMRVKKMEKLIEVLKSKFSDIYIYAQNDGLFCKFNKDTISMVILTATDIWKIRYSPTELFDLSSAEDHSEFFGDIQDVINWFSDDKNIIKIYEVSLQDLSEYCLHREPVFFPPCQDCNTKMDEIRRAYDKLKKQESSDDTINRILKIMWNCKGKHTTSIDKVKMEQIIRDELQSVNPKTDVLDKIEADIEALFKWYPFTKGGAYIHKDDVNKIINKYKTEGNEK